MGQDRHTTSPAEQPNWRSRLRKVISGGRWTRIERLSEDDYRAFLPVFEEVKAAILAEVPATATRSCMAAFSEPETCYLLYRSVRERKPRTMIETGTFIGLSALVCAKALQANHREHGIEGTIYSISLNCFYRVEEPMAIAARACERLGLAPYVRLIEGSSTPLNFMESTGAVAIQREAYLRERLAAQGRESLLDRLAAILGRVDLAYLDSLHYEACQMTEVAALLEHLSPGGCLLIDDALLSKRREDWRYLLSSLLRLDVQTHRLADFVRCGFRFYHAPWIVEAFRWSAVARVSFFRTRRGFLRSIRLERNPNYHSPYGPLSSWYAPESLEEFLEKYELRRPEEARV